MNAKNHMGKYHSSSKYSNPYHRSEGSLNQHLKLKHKEYFYQVNIMRERDAKLR